MNTKSGLIFRAIPDSGKIKVVPDEKGGVKAVWPNCTVFPQEIFNQIEKQANTLWYPRKKDFNHPNVNWIINMCADADEYENGLKALSNLIKGKRLPVFNHPDAVLNTRRDIIAKNLEGVENLVVPKCVRFFAETPESFQETFKANDFEYPVLVRPGASQTGRNLVKIDGASDWKNVHSIPWGGKFMYMTQFVDFTSKNETYQKIRMVFANNKIFFRSFFEGNNWNVHGVQRTKKSILRELEFQKRFKNNKEFLSVNTAIKSSSNLDFWGVDLGLTRDGRFLFFEANASMTIAIDENTPKELFGLMGPIFDPITSNLTNSLSNPNNWKSALKVFA